MDNFPCSDPNHFSRAKKISQEKKRCPSLNSFSAPLVIGANVYNVRNDNTNFFLRSLYRKLYEESFQKKQEQAKQKKMVTPKRSITDMLESETKKKMKMEDGELNKQ